MKFSTIIQSVTVHAPPLKVYDAFMDSRKHAEFTGDSATIDPKVGGSFKEGDGYISGTNLELVRGRKIVQEWKTTEWPEGYPPSRLEITLTPKGNATLLRMVHSNVPAEQSDYYADGWKTYYWNPLKEYFRKQ
jgi:uncharacterized protein YndB with AHSA1/START domain